MKTKSFILIVLGTLLSSCVINEYGEIRVATWFWVLLAILFILLVFAVISGDKELKKTNEVLAERNQKLSDFRIIGNYVGGHPDFDKEIMGVSVRDNGDMLGFYQQGMAASMPYHRFNIKKVDVKSVDIEDASSIESKITLGRIFLVGIFALGWRKKKKNELAFIVVNWNDNRFKHSTTFAFEGKDAMQKANSARNYLIRLAR